MSCIPASHSMSALHSQVDSQIEEGSVERRGSKAYQIFPEPNMDEESDSNTYPVDFLYRRERLPSIVVEPTEQSEVESGERWALRLTHNNVEEEKEEEDSSADHIDSSVDGEQQDDVGTDEGIAGRKSSLVTSQSQPSLSRLTPPASPTPPEAAPPCLRN